MAKIKDDELHNSRLELVFEKRIPGLRVSEAVRHRDFIMRARHFHETIEIHFIIDGQRLMFVDQKTFHLTAGTCVLVNHDLIHKTSVVPGAPPDHRNFILQLDRAVFDDLLRRLGYPDFDTFGEKYGGITRFSPSEWTLVLAVIDEFKEACREVGNNPQAVADLQTYLYLQALELAGIYARSRKRELTAAWKLDSDSEGLVFSSGIHKKVHDIAVYLQNNLTEEYTLDGLAERFFLSKSYMTRVFRTVTGFSVVEYVTFIRVRKAQSLLRETGLSVTEIAEQCGFSNITYFEKVFRTATGVSPGKYRRKDTV